MQQISSVFRWNGNERIGKIQIFKKKKGCETICFEEIQIKSVSIVGENNDRCSFLVYSWLIHKKIAFS